MKILICTIFLCLPSVVYTQVQKTITKFIITESTSNGIDNTQFDYNRGGYFVFYENNLKKICLANVCEKSNDQSYGQIFNINSRTEEETSTTYKTQIFNFRWKYYNTYDSKTGYATIKLSKIYKPQGIVFYLIMILPNLDKLTYTGYMDGSLQLEKY